MDTHAPWLAMAAHHPPRRARANIVVLEVTDYLLKRGFNRTEEVFRQESKHLGPDGKPIQQLATMGPKKYQKAFKLLKEWVDNNLDLYKVSQPILPARLPMRRPCR